MAACPDAPWKGSIFYICGAPGNRTLSYWYQPSRSLQGRAITSVKMLPVTREYLVLLWQKWVKKSRIIFLKKNKESNNLSTESAVIFNWVPEAAFQTVLSSYSRNFNSVNHIRTKYVFDPKSIWLVRWFVELSYKMRHKALCYTASE